MTLEDLMQKGDVIINAIVKNTDHTNPDGSKIKIRSIILDEDNPYTCYKCREPLMINKEA